MKIRLCLAVTLLSFSMIKAQDSAVSEFNYLPDTFKIFTPVVHFVHYLDSVEGVVFDSIENPKAYFINTFKSGSGYGWRIAVQKQKGYDVFDPFDVSVSYASADNISFERFNFDGKGQDELIVRWEFRTGHSSWQGGVYEGETGIQIWDLENMKRYLDIMTSRSLEVWWAEYEEDTTGLMDPDELQLVNSGQEYECFQVEVKIAKREIILEELDCESENQPEVITPSPTPKKRYKLTRKGLLIRREKH